MTAIRVVIVEDHDLTRMGLEAAFQRAEGFEIVGEAANGFQGLKLMEAVKPDVALVDIGLPDIDGIELVRRFKETQTEESSTKIVMLTMHKSQDTVLAAFAAGADSYCMKDIKLDKLTEAVQLTHEGYPWIDPLIASIVLQHVRSTNTATVENKNKVQIRGVEAEYEGIVAAAHLTEREIEILQLIVKGCGNTEIAAQLYITIGTVKTHVRHVLEKLCVDDRTHAAVLALRGGLIE
ncbi:MAG: response regulator transcription factor [Thermosynechococcaceae cyanobacterium]